MSFYCYPEFLTVNIDDAIGDWFEPDFVMRLLANMSALETLRIQGSLVHSFLVGMLSLRPENATPENPAVEATPVKRLKNLHLHRATLDYDSEARPVRRNLHTFLAQRMAQGIPLEKLELTHCKLERSPIREFSRSVALVKWDSQL